MPLNVFTEYDSSTSAFLVLRHFTSFLQVQDTMPRDWCGLLNECKPFIQPPEHIACPQSVNLPRGYSLAVPFLHPHPRQHKTWPQKAGPIL